MTLSTIFELIGYLGSLLVIVSMLMTSVVKLRIINTIGSVIFGVYALLIHSYPTAVLQLFLIIINVINLYKLFSVKKEFNVVKLSGGDLFAKHFLEQNAQDIKKYFPDFSELKESDTVYLVNSHSTCAGILVAKTDSANPQALLVKLDYTTPAYRDTSVAKFLFTYLETQGLQTFKVAAANLVPAHEKYLKKMGFVKKEDFYEKHSFNK